MATVQPGDPVDQDGKTWTACPDVPSAIAYLEGALGMLRAAGLETEDQKLDAIIARGVKTGLALKEIVHRMDGIDQAIEGLEQATGEDFKQTSARLDAIHRTMVTLVDKLHNIETGITVLTDKKWEAYKP